MKVKALILLALTLTLAHRSQAQAWSGIIDPMRAVDWTQAGIPGGIPSGSWTQCGSTIAAYSGSAAAINTALAKCGANQFVLLGPGTFALSTKIDFAGKSNVVLRGSGASSTFLVFASGSGGTCQEGLTQCLISLSSSDGTYPGQPSNLSNWTAGYAKGATSITLSSGSQIKANSTIIVLDQCDTGYSGSTCSGSSVDNGQYFNCSDEYETSNGCSFDGSDGTMRPHRYEVEIVEATSCSPSCGNSGVTTVTINPPLQHPQWNASQTPQAWLIQPIRMSGVENLSIDASAVGSGAAEPIGIANAAYVWVKGVTIKNGWQSGIFSYLSTHVQLEQNYIYNIGQGFTFCDPYGIRYNGANYLIQNNIVQSTRTPFLAEGPAAGSVIGYNYFVNLLDASSNCGIQGDFMFAGIFPHSSGNNYVLYEGNIGTEGNIEDLHGTQPMNTTFRNFFTGWESCANGNCGSANAKDSGTNALAYLSYARYGNIVGNVLGTPGYHTSYQTSAITPSNTAVMVVGTGNGGVSPPVPSDGLVGTTMLRWGNYDVATGGVRFCGSSLDLVWATLCALVSEVPVGINFYPNPLPTVGDTAAGQPAMPASFYLSSQPAWWGSTPWPAIGPEVTGGNIGQCSGALNVTAKFNGLPATSATQCAGSELNTAAWAGHVNAIPAMTCYFSMGGTPDGTGSALSFNASACYGGGVVGPPPGQPNPPTNLTATVQ